MLEKFLKDFDQIFKIFWTALRTLKTWISFWQSVKKLQNSYLKEIAEKLLEKSGKVSENFAEILK